VGHGDNVLVPGYTCVVVPEAVCFLGAKPIFVDIDPLTYNVSFDRIEQAVDAGRHPVKAIVVQHTYGLPVDTAPIVKWARQRGVSVVEDCCHSLGSRYPNEFGRWQDVGTLGDAAFFSSQWSKPVSTGLGGWAATNSTALTERVRSFEAKECLSPSWLECTLLAGQTAGRALFSSPSSFWFAQTMHRFLVHAGIGIGSSNAEELRGEMPRGYAKRMSRFQRWLLQCKMARSGEVIQHRKHLQVIYEEELREAGIPMYRAARTDAVLLRYPVRVDNKEGVLDSARRNRIELGDWFNHPLHPKESNHTALGYRRGMCPNAEDAAQQVINLPLHSRVSEEVARDTVEFLKRVARPTRFQAFA